MYTWTYQISLLNCNHSLFHVKYSSIFTFIHNCVRLCRGQSVVINPKINDYMNNSLVKCNYLVNGEITLIRPGRSMKGFHFWLAVGARLPHCPPRPIRRDSEAVIKHNVVSINFVFPPPDLETIKMFLINEN